jgi:hypothetical protein
MRTSTSKFTVAAGVAPFTLLSSMSLSGPASAVDGLRKHNDVSVNIGNRPDNRGRHLRQRNFSDNGGYGNRNNGRHHRRRRGFGFGDISIDIGSIDSGCR